MDKAIYKVREKIMNYKELLADIQEIDLKVQEIEEEILGVSGQADGERTGKTYKITSSVEQQAEKLMEKKEILHRQQAAMRRDLKRIDNALSILNDEERFIITSRLIEKKEYWTIQEKLNKSYSRVKSIEYDAIKSMTKYLH